MTSPNYYLLGNTLVVSIENGKTYTISNEDPRFTKAKEAIDSNNFDDLINAIDPTISLGSEGFEVKEGVIYFKNHPIPTILGNKFLEFKVNKVSFIGLVNFWLNLKSRLNFENSKEVIVNLLSQDAYPITNDGFYIAYCGRSSRPIKADGNQQSVFFFNHNHYNNMFPTFFKEKRDLESIILEVFGFNSKKLTKLVLTQMFKPNQTDLDTSVLHYGVLFKGILSPNNLFTLMEKDSLKFLTGANVHTSYVNANTFLNAIAKTKIENELSEKRIMNLFTTKRFSNVELNNCAELFSQLTSYNIPLNFENIKLATLADFESYLSRELQKMKNPEYPLRQEVTWPDIQKLADQTVAGLKFVFPQTNYDLADWSRKLNNCIHGFGPRSIKGESLLLAMVEADNPSKMIYNIEICSGSVRQFSGKTNKSPERADVEAVEEVLYTCGLIKEKRRTNHY